VCHMLIQLLVVPHQCIREEHLLNLHHVVLLIAHCASTQFRTVCHATHTA
jgi:hypothetical protein